MQDPTNFRSSSADVWSTAEPGTTASTGKSPQLDASLKDKAAGVVGQGAEKAATLVDQVKDKAVTAVDGQKAGLADQIETLAGTVKQSGQQFRGQQDWIAGAIDRGATELSTLANSLRESDITEIFGNVQNFAKRQPALFIGATFVAGFALARFGKIVAADVSSDDLPSMPKVNHE